MVLAKLAVVAHLAEHSLGKGKVLSSSLNNGSVIRR